MGLRFYILIDLGVLGKKTPVKKEETSSDESNSDDQDTKSGTKTAAIKKGGKSNFKIESQFRENIYLKVGLKVD